MKLTGVVMALFATLLTGCFGGGGAIMVRGPNTEGLAAFAARLNEYHIKLACPEGTRAERREAYVYTLPSNPNAWPGQKAYWGNDRFSSMRGEFYCK